MLRLVLVALGLSSFAWSAEEPKVACLTHAIIGNGGELSFDPPYTAEEFQKAYENFIFLDEPTTLSAHSLEKSAVDFFHDPEYVDNWLRKGLDQYRKDRRWQKWPTNQDIEDSMYDPLSFNSILPGSWKVDRVAIFRGDVYPNEYFNHYKNAKKINFDDPLYLAMDANYKPLHPDHLRDLPLAQWKTVAAEEPWLEWDAAQKKFVFRTSGAAERLLSGMANPDETISLFRGTHVSEKNVLLFQKKNDGKALTIDDLNDMNKLVSAWRAGAREIPPLKEQIAAALAKGQPLTVEESQALMSTFMKDYQLTQISSGNGNAFFTTDNNGKASFFATQFHQDPTVMEFKLKLSDLLKLAQEGKIYVGYEGVATPGIEIAFFDPDAVKLLSQSLVEAPKK